VFPLRGPLPSVPWSTLPGS